MVNVNARQASAPTLRLKNSCFAPDTNSVFNGAGLSPSSEDRAEAVRTVPGEVGGEVRVGVDGGEVELPPDREVFDPLWSDGVGLSDSGC